MNLRDAQATAAVVAEWAPRLETSDAREARARLDDAHASLEASVEWAIDSAPSLAADMVVGGATYWVCSGLTGLASAWAVRLLEVFGGPTEQRARLLATIVRLGGVRRDVVTESYAQEAVGLGTTLALRDVTIEALYELADGAGTSGPDPRGVIAVLRQVRELGPETVRERAILLDLEAAVARGTGGPDAEATTLARGLDEARRTGMLRRMVHLGGNLCDLQLWLGRTATAGALAAEAALDAREIGDGRNEARALGVLAVVHALGGDRERAGRAVRRAVLLATAIDTPLCSSHALRSTALVAAIADRPADAAWLLGASEALEPVPESDEAPFALRRALVRARGSLGSDAWATEGFSCGRAGPGAALLRAASVAHALSGGGWPAGATALGLSQREVEVLSCLGEGLSDIEIGQRLFISPKTVSVHLANARRKTGARSRVELALLGRELLAVGADG